MSYIYAGTTVDNAVADDYGQGVPLIRKDDFKRVCGRYFDQARDVMLAMNADYSAQPKLHGLHTYYSSGSGTIWARFEGVTVGASLRLNWLIVLGA